MRRHNQLETNNHTIVVDTERLNCANDDGVCLLLNDTRSSQQQRSRQQRRRRQLQQCLLNQWWILGIGLLLLYQNVLWSSAVSSSSSSSSSSGEENWETFSRDYQDRFQRIPPSGLDQWFKFAKHKQCETQKYYNVIDEQLRVFRDNNDKLPLLSLNDVIQEALTYNELHNAFEVKQNKLSLFQIKEKENGDHNKPWLLAKIDRYNKECTKRWLLQPLVKHQPPLSTRFVWNIMDEPTVNPKVPIFSACNEDLQLDDDNDYEMNRTVVTTTKTSNDDTATTLAVVKDLLIPYHFSIGFLARGLWFWPFFSHGKPWRDRTNTIIWRGSTTGDWGTGPRFRLLEQYNNNNGNNGKVLVFPSGVTADFAFSKVVQSKGRQLDAKYRLADRMSYRDMQKHKYVLDVDGNCK